MSNWRQVKINASHLINPSDDDCMLSPNDPAYELMRLQYLAGLGQTPKLLETTGNNITHTAAENAKIMKDKNIKPGTPEWFQLWFSLPHLTGERKHES
jgi:hypothetical protein